MNPMAEWLLPTGLQISALNAALTSLLACTVALVICRIGRWSLPVRHGIFVAALATCLVTPALSMILPWPSLWELPLAAEMAPTPSHITSEAPDRVSEEPIRISDRALQPSATDFTVAEPVVTPTEIAAASPSTSLPEVGAERFAQLPVDRLVGSLLCIAWLGGTAFLMLGAARRLIRVCRWQSHLREITSPELIEAAALAAPAAGLSQPVRLRCSPSLPAPVSFGLLRPCIVVPEGIESTLSDEQLRAVLQHESAHLARGDLWVGLLQQFVQTVFWWNPLVWSVNRHIGDLREQICDDIAVQHLSEPVDYASILVQFAERACGEAAIPATLGIGASPPSQLEGRVRRLIAPRLAIRLRLTRWAVAGVLSLLAGTTAVVGIAQIPPEPVVAASAATPPAEDAPVPPTTTVSDEAAAASPAGPNPTLTELIQHLQDWERAYLPCELKAELRYRVPQGLSPVLRAQLTFDSTGREEVLEFAALKKGVWRMWTTRMVDGAPSNLSTEYITDLNRAITVRTARAVNGKDPEGSVNIRVNERKDSLSPFYHASPLICLFGHTSESRAELYSKGLAGKHQLDLEWEDGDARLTLREGGDPTHARTYSLWLSRAHNWHPRKFRFGSKSEQPYYTEWEATKFVRKKNRWRVTDGVHRYGRGGEVFYFIDFHVVSAKYGEAVDPKQFEYEIPAGIPVQFERDPEQAAADPASPSENAAAGPDAAQATADSPLVLDATLAEMVQRIWDWEQIYLRSEIHAELNYVAPENLSSALRARLMFDSQGEKKLYESAILKPGLWREKTTRLVDGKPFPRSTECFVNENRRIYITPSRQFPGIESDAELDILVSDQTKIIDSYPLSMPLSGLFNASPRSVADLYAEGLRGEHELRLEWDAGDAKLTLLRKAGTHVIRYVHWLSRAHDWHPRKSQVAMRPDKPIFHHEWEATRFARHGNHWRIDEGAYRTFERGELFYTVEFKVLKALFGDAVDPKQFAYEIPPGTPFRTDREPETTEPAPLPTPKKTRTVKFTVVTPEDQPIQQATISLRPNTYPTEKWDVLTTNDEGMASSSKVPADEDVVVETSASGFRPTVWVLGFNELRIVMIPFTPGTVLDPAGKPAAKTWITHKELQFRPDGLPAGYPQYREQNETEWSDDNGKFELQSEVTARSGMGRMRYVAIDPSLDQMAVGAMPIREMRRPQQLQLQPVCRVHGHYVAEGVTDERQIFNRLELASGEYIGWLQVQSRRVDKDLHVNFAIRLPAGDYVIRSLPTDEYPGFRFPFTVPADRKELDLGDVKLLPIIVDRLLGQPAPPLNVQWRAGEEQTWERLKGQVVVLDFWGLWCGPCLLDAPEVFQIYDRFKDRPVKWISIHTAELKTFAEFDELVASRTKSVWKGRSIPFPTVLDRQSPDDDHLGATSRKYGVAEWPTLIVVDQQGTVTGTVRKEDLAARIEHLLKTAEQN